jgi:hypothetical protein
MGLLLAVVMGGSAAAQDTQPPVVSRVDPGVELRLGMRKLWGDHVSYLRSLVVSTLADLPDRDAVFQRLLRNQDDIGDALKLYYGSEVGDKLARLLREHIRIAGEVVRAARAGRKDALADQERKWSQNGNDLAAFLAELNPAWSKSSLEAMIQKHLDLTTREVTCRLEKDWTGDLQAYDEGREHMLFFSDTLSSGIRRQFPARFSP